MLQEEDSARGRKCKYDINEESKALELSNNKVHDKFTQSLSRGLLIAAKYSIIFLEGVWGSTPRVLSFSNFFFDSFLSTDNRFVGGHYRVAARS